MIGAHERPYPADAHRLITSTGSRCAAWPYDDSRPLERMSPTTNTKPRIAFIGAGSTVFMKNLVGDMLRRPALADATIALMDIDPVRLDESAVIARRVCEALGARATIETHLDQRAALDGADFVVVCFQIGGYEPCTVTDFEVPRTFGLRQTIADTLGIAASCAGAPCRTCGRSARTCWRCARRRSCPVRQPMAIIPGHLGALSAIRQVGLCHRSRAPLKNSP